ncbi:MAG: alpha/beta hydrolase [Thermoleophilaceae bacterium]
MRRADERGQASGEYVALLALVALALGGAASSVPRVTDRVPFVRPDRAICAALTGRSCGGREEDRTGAGASGVPAASRSSVVSAAAPASGGPASGADADADGLPDAEERALGVDPLRADSDGDGRSDRRELAAGRNPLARAPREEWARERVMAWPAPDPRRAAPSEVARFFARAGPADRERLLRRYPEIVGRLDGAPPELRYEANRLLVRRAEPMLRADLRRLRGPSTCGVSSSVAWQAGCRLDAASRARRRRVLRGRLRRLDEWAAPDRRFLVFDPRGDGRAAEVIGDLERAPHVAVAVPGMGSRIDHMDEFASRARRLRAAARRETGAEVAVVAWLDYDPPDNLAGAALAGPARRGAGRLARLTAGIRQRNHGHLTVIGHSYGSLLAGTSAARRGLEADDLVLTGSPGTGGGRRHVSELGGRSRVWAAEAPGDMVSDAPLHGRDPAHPRFGARRFDASGQERGLREVRWNHLGYDRPGSRSLANVARIVGGRGDLTTSGRVSWLDELGRTRR